MSDLKNSLLLERIFQKAEALAQDNGCVGLSREYVMAAALDVLQDTRIAAELSGEDQVEYAVARALLMPKVKAQNPVEQLLQVWRGKQISLSERIMIISTKNQARMNASASGSAKVRADQYLSVLLQSDNVAIKSILEPDGKPVPAAVPAAPKASPAVAPAAAPAAEKPQPAEEKGRIGDLVSRTKKLHAELSSQVLGQAHAVSTFTAGYFQAELQSALAEKRNKPKATFLFAGPPGVGKTFLSEQSARLLELPYIRFDMSEFADDNSIDELVGTDPVYKGAHAGKLTDFVKMSPQCVILFDEIEKAHLKVIHLFLQVLDAGRLKDKFNGENIDFSQAILIFTTNAGKKLYEDSESQNLSGMSRKVILDALGQDLNPATQEPLFPQAICSRFASGNVVMFNHLPAHILHSIVARQLKGHLDRMEKELRVTSELDPNVVTALLLAEGAAADARTVKSRADAFFGGELYELYRLATSGRANVAPDQISKLHIDVELPEDQPEITSLFVSSEPVEVLVFSQKPLALPTMPGRCHFTCFADAAEAEQAIKKSDCQLVLCAIEQDKASKYLNKEDVDSGSRDLLFGTLEKYPDLPVYLVEQTADDFTDEEKESFLQRGVRGFVRAGAAFLKADLLEVLDTIHQQNSLRQLARSNRLVSYESAQHIHDDGKTAHIILFDLKLQTAVSADDKGNVLSNMSRPDTRFDDVIGAEDAKDELKHFADFLRNPRKYMGTGVSAPKGILLYGPPGTGKTLMAKALAGETGVTFIAAEGNQFFSKWVGSGQEMVHKLFATARRYAPSILFVDEIDTIARARSGGDDVGSQVQEQILTAFFAEMDGFKTDPTRPVFVIGATNYGVDASRGKALDAAMLRRFDRQIYVDLPNKAERAKFLRMRCAANPAFQVSDSMIDAISARSTGMSLALLSNVLELALRNAMKTGVLKVDDAALDEALETYNSGEKKNWKPEIVLRTARHEAGHTLLSWLGGEKPSYVTIVSRADHGGYMQHEDAEERFGYTRQELLWRIRAALGGRAAELVCYGAEDGVSTGASNDLRNATSMANSMLCTYGMDEAFGLATMSGKAQESMQAELRSQVNRILYREMEETVRLVGKYRGALDEMVRILLEKNHLNGEDIDKILSAVVK